MSVSKRRMNFQNIKNVFKVFSRENHKGKANFGLYSLDKPENNSDLVTSKFHDLFFFCNLKFCFIE